MRAAWICPGCDRQVPSGIDVCRCGTSRTAAADPHAEPVVSSPGATPGLSPRAILLTALAIIALGAVYLWHEVSMPSRVVAGGAPDTLPGGTIPLDADGSAARTASAGAAPAAERTRTPSASTPATTAFARIAPDAPEVPAPLAPAITPAPPREGPAGIEDLVARATGAVVMVETTGSRGTGFFVRPDLLVTNDHVIAGAGSVTIRLHDGSTRAARVERTVPDVDLAVLRTATAAAPAVLSLGSVDTVRTGQEVIAIGSALGLQSTVTRGIVSARRQAGSVVLLQTDAAINPGNSGGPLIDRQGQVVGVTTLKIGRQAEGLGFAVAADHVTALVEGRSSAAVASAAGAPAPSATGAATFPAFAGTGSSVDAQRTAGEAAFEREMQTAARQAAQIDGYWTRFAQACTPQPRRGGDREWFGLAGGRVDYGGGDRNCPYWLDDITTMGRDFETAMRDAIEAARRAGVYPGTLRDVRRRHRLDWIGFDR